ncbi:MAPEG family protein [Hirsutella rhossiliensis]|uniref:MAPEG family domain-containing protein n=1 Tax=Hirsutella rhossiliensis TaxID=111463 RepID=A0A9P8SHH5_9HYPO|nr:MAPEG family domain-containing protein [Hirsutella rhossiliensis]KAH0963108.1 MAPEG family domain-containing protein [Hirsutella rhossiliensis]
MSSAIGFDLDRNMSILTVPVAFLMCWAPHAYAGILAGRAFDNANPRGFRDNVAKSEALDKAMKQRILRAEGASLNGFETLGFFASAVVAANVAGLRPAQLNVLTIGYIVSRLAYLVIYIHLQTNRRRSWLRSGAWLTGVGLVLTIWIRAGLAMLRAP